MSAQESINKIRAASKKMNETIARIDEMMRQVEQELVSMGLGLDEAVAGEGVRLAFERHGGSFKFTVTELEKDTRAWCDATREMRLAAFGLLPRLMIALEAKAERLLAKYNTAVCNSIKFERE